MNLNPTKVKQRYIGIDLIKCIAVLCVISVHFFLNIYFYNATINNAVMYVMTFLRTAFMVCVPLFMMSTGFLMINKELSKGYYKGMIKTVSIYIILSVLTVMFRHFHLSEHYTLKSAIIGILNFKALSYSWYIEMYIGLFLIIPFLNLAYNGLKSDKQRTALVLTMLCLTALPTLFNYTDKIFPNFWVSLYPITYYFLGAHIRKTQKDGSKKFKYLVLFIAIIFINSFVNINISKGNKFTGLPMNDWGGIQNVLSSLCLFLFINGINFEKTPKAISYCITKISEYSLGIYLSSYMVDKVVYSKFNSLGYTINEKLKYFIPIVAIVFVLSFVISIFANLIYKLISKLCKKIYNSFK